MPSKFRKVTIALAFSLGVTAIPTMLAAPRNVIQDQDHHDDHHDNDHRDDDHRDQQRNYSNNRYYNLGNREGYQDYNHKTERKEHNHKYRNDDDRQAHDYGYQQGLQGQRGYHQDPH